MRRIAAASAVLTGLLVVVGWYGLRAESAAVLAFVPLPLTAVIAIACALAGQRR